LVDSRLARRKQGLFLALGRLKLRPLGGRDRLLDVRISRTARDRLKVAVGGYAIAGGDARLVLLRARLDNTASRHLHMDVVTLVNRLKPLRLRLLDEGRLLVLGHDVIARSAAQVLAVGHA